MNKSKEIEIEKITEYDNYYKKNLNLLTEQEREILNKLSISYWTKRIKDGWLEHVCRNCKNIYITDSETYTICSQCKNELDKEIDEFEEYIKNKYVDIANNNNNGIYARIKLILFAERELILNKKFTPCGLYYYMNSNKLNIDFDEIMKISRTIKNVYEITKFSNNCEYNDFDFLSCDYGNGASNVKFIKALKYCINLIPEIYTKYARVLSHLLK